MPITIGVDAYADLTEAEEFFAGHYFKDLSPWENASEVDKEAALRTASSRIDRNAFVGRKVDPDQALEFPRCYPVVEDDEPGEHCEPNILPNIKRAVFEEALVLLAGESSDLRARLQREGVTQVRIGAVSESYSGSGGERAGLASWVAADYIQPYLKSKAGFG